MFNLNIVAREKFIIENLGLLIAVFFLIGLVLLQHWKIKYLEKLVVNTDDLKSRAEFETKESQAGAYFQEKVIGELLKEFSDEELMAIEDKMARHIRRISNMEIQDGDTLKELDIYRLCRRYAAFENRNRRKNAETFAV